MALAAELLKAAFARAFRRPPFRAFRAPGRVNLIGEHTDYTLGFVLPMALDFACCAAAAPGRDGRLRVWSEDLGESREWPLDSIGALEPAHDWSDYVVGVAQQLLRAGCEIPAMDVLVWSDVPVGAGLSSSAALEVSTALALLDGRPMDGLELARLCRRAEGEFVGMPCGIMDQYVSVFGRENAAIRIDCRNLEHEAVPLPPGVAIVAVNSMVKHELGQSAYRDRVRECAAAVDIFRVRRPEIASLRDVSVSGFEPLAGGLPELLRRRARHVITENQRVTDFVAACRRGDLRSMGSLFVASHRSLQEDYEVSCEELDFLVDAALGLPGVLGARMTGGGFGGCTVNLLVPEALPEFGTALAGQYADRFGISPQVYPCYPSAGAGEVPLR